VAPDGLRGGSAHVHLASTEGYVVLSGAGRLQTLGARGYAETPLRPGYAAALRLAGGHTEDWRDRWRSGAMTTAALTGVHLDEIDAGLTGHLSSAGLWRIERPADPRSYGMCGRLTMYPAERAVRAG